MNQRDPTLGDVDEQDRCELPLLYDLDYTRQLPCSEAVGRIRQHRVDSSHWLPRPPPVWAVGLLIRKIVIMS